MSEDPKSFLRQASSSKIWPSENYYLNIWRDGERWQDGEFCPGQVNNNNEFMQFDGMYGLVDAVYQAIGLHGDDPNPEQEEQFEKAMEVYDTAFFGSIKQGITSGTVDGAAGRYHWQLVYDPSREGDREPNYPFERWIDQIVPVRPGETYGTKITPKTDWTQWRAFGGDVDPMAESIALAVLDGEDPKRVFKQMQGPEPLFLVKVSVFNRNLAKHRDVGSFIINAETRRVTKQNWAPYFQDRPKPEDLRDIAASLLAHGDKMGGHYPKSDPWPGRFHWEAEYAGDIMRHRPLLVVEGPGWTVRGPIMKSTEHGDYIWRFKKLTPEQLYALRSFGEFIHYGLNDGSLRGRIDNEDTWEWGGDENFQPTGPIEIKWYVIGNLDFAPEGSWHGSDWSGQAAPLP